jgi:hypothetical protein
MLGGKSKIGHRPSGLQASLAAQQSGRSSWETIDKGAAAGLALTADRATWKTMRTCTGDET